MASKTALIDAYLEVGRKKVFAGALNWPCWCRSGGDEGAELTTLVAYAPRYAHICAGTLRGDPGRDLASVRSGGPGGGGEGTPQRPPWRWPRA